MRVIKGDTRSLDYGSHEWDDGHSALRFCISTEFLNPASTKRAGDSRSRTARSFRGCVQNIADSGELGRFGQETYMGYSQHYQDH